MFAGFLKFLCNIFYRRFILSLFFFHLVGAYHVIPPINAFYVAELFMEWISPA